MSEKFEEKTKDKTCPSNDLKYTKSSNLTNIFREMIDPMEDANETYTGKYEMAFYFYSLLLFGMYRVLTGSDAFFEKYGQNVRQAPFLEGAGYLLFDVIFSTLAYTSVILLATKPAQKWTNRTLKQNHGRTITIVFIITSLFYLFLGMGIGFPQMNTWKNVLSKYLWGSDLWYIKALILAFCFYIGLQTVLLFAQLRSFEKGLIPLMRASFGKEYLNLKKKVPENPGENHQKVNTSEITPEILKKFGAYFVAFLFISPLCVLTFDLKDVSWVAALAPIAIFLLFFLAKIPAFNGYKDGFNLGDLLTAALGAGVTFLFQTVLPLMWCYSLPIAVILVVNSTGFGRAHFNYSYVPKKGEEIPELANMVLLAIITFIPLAALVKFIELGAFWQNTGTSALTIVKYMGIWIYLTGTGEEIMFRVGLLILLRDYFSQKARHLKKDEKFGFVKKRPTLTALIVAAIIFGLAHFPKGWNYAFLAIVAGVLYGVPFCKNKNLYLN